MRRWLKSSKPDPKFTPATYDRASFEWRAASAAAGHFRGRLQKVIHEGFLYFAAYFLDRNVSVSFLIPSFFVQNVSAFSIIQFFWIGYVIMIIPTAFLIGEKLIKVSIKKVVIICVVLILLFAPEVTGLLFNYSINPSGISSGLVKQISIMKTIPLNEGIMITDRIKGKNGYVDMFDSPIFWLLVDIPSTMNMLTHLVE